MPDREARGESIPGAGLADQDRPEFSQGRATPGDPALAQQETDKEQVDRYVEWQHDPATEYLRGGR